MRVAIVGAGICGLTLAAALRQKAENIAVSLFEADEAPESRSQGYAIGLKDESGLGVLEQLSLRSALLARGASRIRAFYITAQDGTELLAAAANKGEKNSTYRIQRHDIKAILTDAVPDIHIQYAKHCVRYEQSGDGVRLEFADGSTVSADYVVACDGAGSTFRKQLHQTEKHYSGLTSIYGDALVDVTGEPLLDDGFFITLGDNGSSLLAYQQTGGVLFSYSFASDHPDALGERSKTELLELVQSGTLDWYPLVEKIVAGIDKASLGTRAFYDWAPEASLLDGHVLLIGDAAHPMTPFQGQAANVGMLDAVEVAALLGDWAHDSKMLDRKLVKLEAAIRRRGRKNVLQSRQSGLDFHITDRAEQRKRALILKTVNAGIKMLNMVKQPFR